jgi:molecular chaperone DnaJ
MPGAPTHYERLGVAPTASPAEIRAAYRAVARRLHPDTGSAAGAAEMAAVNEAWRVLSDPGRRALYDRSLAAGAAVAPPSAPGRDESADRVDEVSPASRSGGRFPIWPFVALFVLAVIFIVTTGGLSDDPQPPTPDNLIVAGSCVDVLAGGDAVEVACDGAHDAVAVTVVGFDQVCPSGTEPHRDRQGRGYVCADPVD